VEWKRKKDFCSVQNSKCNCHSADEREGEHKNNGRVEKKAGWKRKFLIGFLFKNANRKDFTGEEHASGKRSPSEKKVKTGRGDEKEERVKGDQESSQESRFQPHLYTYEARKEIGKEIPSFERERGGTEDGAISTGGLFERKDNRWERTAS